MEEKNKVKIYVNFGPIFSYLEYFDFSRNTTYVYCEKVKNIFIRDKCKCTY